MPSMRQGRWNNPTQNADYFMSTSPGGASCCQEASDFNRWKNSHNNNSSSTSRQSSPMEDITTAIEKLEKKKSLISNFNSTSRYQERSVSSPASSTKPSSSSTYPSQSSSWRLTTCGTSQMSSFNTWQQSTTDSSPRPSSQSFLSSNSSHKNDHLMSMDWDWSLNWTMYLCHHFIKVYKIYKDYRLQNTDLEWIIHWVE